MAVNWTPVVMDVGVGGGAGVADQLVQNWDAKRKRADPALSLWQEGGTYLNYVAPAVAVVALAMGWLREPWASRVVLAGAQLAGRKATYTMTKAEQSAPYRPVPNYQARQSGPVPQIQKPGFEKVGIL